MESGLHSLALSDTPGGINKGYMLTSRKSYPGNPDRALTPKSPEGNDTPNRKKQVKASSMKVQDKLSDVEFDRASLKRPSFWRCQMIRRLTLEVVG